MFWQNTYYKNKYVSATIGNKKERHLPLFTIQRDYSGAVREKSLQVALLIVICSEMKGGARIFLFQIACQNMPFSHEQDNQLRPNNKINAVSR